MARALSLAEARLQFAEELRVIAHLLDERVVDAFAAVPRERFAGPGPWRIRNAFDGYWTTSDADPRWLCHNVLIALDERRGLNIGEPFLWSYHFDRIGVRPGARVLQLGTGSGYYTAVLAELAGPEARVDGIEIDATLASTAQHNLEAWPNAHVHVGDATAAVDGQWDLIVAFAGATAPRAWWLDGLADGGRLLLPMTAGNFGHGGGFMLRLDRRGDDYAARSVGSVGFYPLVGARNDNEAGALGRALGDAAGQSALKSLRRDCHDAEESCWLHGDGWCLSKREMH